LLELGADPNEKDIEGFSPLAKAAQSGYLDCVHALVDGGATVTTTTYWGLEPIHGYDEQGQPVVPHSDRIYKLQIYSGT
jgi:ankyrin repeat protein